MEKLGRLVNLFTRALTLISKFVLLLTIAYFLEPTEVGLYGIVVATVSFGMYVVGLDFSSYSSRELLALDKNSWGIYIKSQAMLHAVAYVLLLGVFFIALFQDYISWELFLWLVLLLLCEHGSQEIRRLLIINQRQNAAGIVLFLRSGLWCLVAVGVLVLFESARSLKLILSLWVAGGVGAIALGVFFVSQLGLDGWRGAIKWQWLTRGIKVAMPLLMGTLSIKAILTLDRYYFVRLVSLEVLGAYAFYIGISNSLMSFLDSGVFSYSYPKLINFSINNDTKKLKNEVMDMVFFVVIIVSIYFVSLCFSLPFFLRWVGKEVYFEHQNLAWALSLFVSFYALSSVFNYALYALRDDFFILVSNISVLFLFSSFVFLLSKLSHYWAVPLALVFSFLLLTVLKAYRLVKLCP